MVGGQRIGRGGAGGGCGGSAGRWSIPVLSCRRRWRFGRAGGGVAGDRCGFEGGEAVWPEDRGSAGYIVFRRWSGAGVRCRCAVPMCGAGVRCQCAASMCSADVWCRCVVSMCGAGVQCWCAVLVCGAGV